MVKYLCVFFLVITFLSAQSQGNIRFESTVNAGTVTYFTGLVMVDPGEGWQGYYLPREAGTGIQLTSSNGISISDNFHLGVGAGYAYISKTSGLMLFADLRADFSRRKPFAMFAYFNPGYSHFWNQYDGGTGTAMLDFGLGVRYKVMAKSKIMLSAGLLSMQMNTYISMKLGYTF